MVVVTTPLLDTKLYVPRSRRGLVPRPRLSERLDRGAASKLVLVSAPAGFGKTTLLAEWLTAATADGWSSAWLSLDQRDNDPALFWTYLVAALRKAEPGVGGGVLSLLQSPQPPSEAILATLLNDLSGISNDVVLVLDDYHVIDAGDVQDGMTFLLEHLPAQVHLVIASRADPALPLARLRGRGELVEIRAVDLRFTPDEVLQRQPEHVRSFLLQTSILDRLSGSLCDAVTGQDGGKAKLVALERGNLFLVPLDDRRRWYRYHHLFADVLQAHLLDEQPDDVPDLHRRASAWYEENGEPSEAINHALATGDFARAADLLERAIPAMRRSRQQHAVRGWIEALPDELVCVRPVLSVGYAGALLVDGEIEGVEDRLRDAEQRLNTATGQGIPDGHMSSAGMVVVEAEEFRRLPGVIEVYRVALAQARGEVLDTVRHARRALELSPHEEHLVRASAAGFLGLASWASGDLADAHREYAECMAGLQLVGYDSDALGCAIALADIRVAQGRLGEAVRTYQQALQRAPEQGGSVLRGTADMYVGMSQIHRERDD